MFEDAIKILETFGLKVQWECLPPRAENGAINQSLASCFPFHEIHDEFVHLYWIKPNRKKILRIYILRRPCTGDTTRIGIVVRLFSKDGASRRTGSFWLPVTSPAEMGVLEYLAPIVLEFLNDPANEFFE